MKKDECEKAYADFQTVLGQFPENLSARMGALTSAGKLGDLEETRKQYAMLVEYEGVLSVEQLLHFW